VAHDPLVELDGARDQRRLDLAGLGDEVDDGMPHERRVGLEPGARGDALVCRCAQQVQREVDRRPAPRDVVLQIRVQALVAKVELGCERDHDDVEVERVELEHVGEAHERPAVAGERRRVVAPEERRCRSTREHPRRLVVVDIQPAMRVGLGARAECGLCALDRAAQNLVEASEGRAKLVEEVLGGDLALERTLDRHSFSPDRRRRLLPSTRRSSNHDHGPREPERQG